MKNFFFDLDGTLIDSKTDIRAALIDALIDVGINTSSVANKIVIGKQLSPLLRDLFPDISLEQETKVIKSFRQNYDLSNFNNTIPYPEIEVLLRKLHRYGVSLFIVTNKPKVPTYRIIEMLKWDSFFVELFSPNSIENKVLGKSELLRTIIQRHSYDPTQCIMIGDSEEDFLAGKTCGINTGLVGWGYGNANKSNSPADFWFDSAEQIAELV